MSCKPACATCERLRGAALELVGGGGIEALSEDSLGASVGLTPAEVRAHYATPEACMYEMYEEVSCSVLMDLADAFSQDADWPDRINAGRQRLIDRIVANPEEARIVFIESMRDPVLRRRRAVNRKWIIEYLANEARTHGGESMSPMQFELMIGAGYQMIANAIASGDMDQLEALEPKLLELGACFIPSAV